MGDWMKLTAEDGHAFDVYRAAPEGKPRGAVVVVQEIFGVNPHIRNVADGYAEAGYLALAPAIYDRVEPGLECGYTPDDIAKGRDWRAACDLEKVMLDLSATVDEAGKSGKVGMVGYCWGGTLTFVSACRLAPRLSAASGYYGGQIMPHIAEQPGAATMLHFGELDKSIPLDDVEAIRAAHPEVEVFVYKGAGHGFNCDHRVDHHPTHAATALKRTLDLFARHLDGDGA